MSKRNHEQCGRLESMQLDGPASLPSRRRICARQGHKGYLVVQMTVVVIEREKAS